MGRKRKDGDPLGLAGTRLALRRGKFWYRHRTGRWEDCGTDIASAKLAAAKHNDPGQAYGTIKWWLGEFITDCKLRASAKTLSERTRDDYMGYAADDGPLVAYFGAMFPESLKPSHVQTYLEDNSALGRPTQANRERACLSSMLSWMIRTGKAPAGMVINPCMRASGVRRNPEKRRERYVTDAEYRAVFAIAGDTVRLMMELVYRTLQRPEVDVLAWTPSNVRLKAEGRVLHFRQSKTKRPIDIALVGVFDDLVRKAIGEVPKLHQPIVHTRAGQAYSYDGISAMLKRAIGRARLATPALASMPSFGYRDLKGKGATDMYRSGVAIELIQALCGHADKATTEIYIKQRWLETAQPNQREISA
ncbi:MAG: tyrosine-type recombinase/integrase [Burkholderiaceae bacterium]